MDKEQEGIEIETLDPENEGIIIPEETDVEDTVEESNDADVTDTKTEDDTDVEKENLKKGVNYERKQRKSAEKKVKELEAKIKELEEANKTPEKTTLEELIESGVDESIAKSIATAIDKKQSNSKQTEKELADIKFKLSLSEASKNPDFSDIIDYSDEIKELVDKGLTIEQSYYALTGGKKSINTNSEIERKLEKKIENKQARKEILGNINNSGTSVNSNAKQIKATAEEIAIAKAAGMSIEDYLAVKSMDNVKEYTEYSKNKGK